MKTRIVILAAGEGRRMGAAVPKVLLGVAERPMIVRLLESVKKAGIDSRPVIVVGQKSDNTRKALGDGYDYVIQKEQLGTGHAVLCAEEILRDKADAVIVLYGDHPCVLPETIRRMIEAHEANNPVITMATATVPDFDEWRKPLTDFGRVVRNKNGDIQAIVEKKDATPYELKIREVNPSYFCFNAAWLWENLKKIDNKNAQEEYYLTDLVRIAIGQGKKVITVDVSPLEAIGVNTPEHLELVRKLVR